MESNKEFQEHSINKDGYCLNFYEEKSEIFLVATDNKTKFKYQEEKVFDGFNFMLVKKLNQTDIISLIEQDYFLEIQLSISKVPIQLKKSYTVISTEKDKQVIRGQIKKEQAVQVKEEILNQMKMQFQTSMTRCWKSRIKFEEFKFKEPPFIQTSLICSEHDCHFRIINLTSQYFDVKFWSNYNPNISQSQVGVYSHGNKGKDLDFILQYELRSNDFITSFMPL